MLAGYADAAGDRDGGLPAVAGEASTFECAADPEGCFAGDCGCLAGLPCAETCAPADGGFELTCPPG